MPADDLGMSGHGESPIPAHRFGALLTTSRVSRGLELEDLVEISGGSYSAEALFKAERGLLQLEDDVLRRLCRLYEVKVGSAQDNRSRLVVDLSSRRLAVGDQSIDLKLGGIDRSDEEQHERQVAYILERYLSLVYILRQIDPGEQLPLREPDLLVLSQSLTYEVESLERLLTSMMRSPAVSGRTKALLKRFLVPNAGLMVGTLALGALVIIGGSDVGSLSTPVSERQMVAYSEGDTLAAATPGSEVRTQAELTAIGAQAEAMIGYDWKSILPEWTVTYMNDSARYKGLTQRSTKSIVIYVDAGAAAHDVAGVLAHEIGHAIDITHLDDDARVRWLKARDLPMVWWAGDGLSDFSVGAGDFAEAVAASWVNSPSDSSFGAFTEDQLSLVEDLLP